jgi:hypothetical protein
MYLRLARFVNARRYFGSREASKPALQPAPAERPIRSTRQVNPRMIERKHPHDQHAGVKFCIAN